MLDDSLLWRDSLGSRKHWLLQGHGSSPQHAGGRNKPPIHRMVSKNAHHPCLLSHPEIILGGIYKNRVVLPVGYLQPEPVVGRKRRYHPPCAINLTVQILAGIFELDDVSWHFFSFAASS